VKREKEREREKQRERERETERETGRERERGHVTRVEKDRKKRWRGRCQRRKG